MEAGSGTFPEPVHLVHVNGSPNGFYLFKFVD
jgi:hypothetical protein